jgi:hypothetical protein
MQLKKILQVFIQKKKSKRLRFDSGELEEGELLLVGELLLEVEFPVEFPDAGELFGGEVT